MPELTLTTRSTREDFERDLLAFICGPLSTRRGARGEKAARGDKPLGVSINTRQAAPPIDASTPLFETGLIDSLAIIDLLAFVEGAIGRRIPMRQIDMRYFGSVERIVRTFWPESTTEGNS
jgi:acyl carrier protein